MKITIENIGKFFNFIQGGNIILLYLVRMLVIKKVKNNKNGIIKNNKKWNKQLRLKVIKIPILLHFADILEILYKTIIRDTLKKDF